MCYNSLAIHILDNLISLSKSKVTPKQIEQSKKFITKGKTIINANIFYRYKAESKKSKIKSKIEKIDTFFQNLKN